MIANAIALYVFMYLLPVVAGGIWAFFGPGVRGSKGWLRTNILVIHGACILSAVLSQTVLYATGRGFPWALDAWSLLYLAAGVGAAVFLIGPLGMVYPFSAFIQEATIFPFDVSRRVIVG